MLSKIGNGVFKSRQFSLLGAIVTLVFVFFLDFKLGLSSAAPALYLLGHIFLYEQNSKRLVGLYSLTTSLLIIASFFLFGGLDATFLVLLNKVLLVLLMWIAYFLVVNSYSDQEGVESLMRKQKLQFVNMTADVQDYGIFLANPDGFIENWNKGVQRLTGYTKGEVLGKHVDLVYEETDLERHPGVETIKKARQSGSAIYEGKASRKDSAPYWANITVTAIKHPEEGIIGYSHVIHDRTRFKENEERLLKHNQQIEEKNKELEQFAYITTHDLQEPLRTIESYVTFLDEHYSLKLDERGKKCMGFIVTSARKMSILLKSLLDYSIIGESDKKEPISSGDLFEEVESNLKEKIEASNAKIIKGSTPVFSGFKPELVQLLTHLVDNSIKFRKPDTPPVVKISAEPKSEAIEFSVSDNGIGIDPEFKEKAFLIFQQLHDRNVYEGSGIGLAHCKKIVELHGGKIWFESEEGQGTTFFFTIPLS